MRGSRMGRLILTALVASGATTLLVVGISGGTPQAIGPGEFVVVDSTGKQLGIVIDTTNAAIPHNGEWLRVSVTPGEVKQDELYFKQNTDCTGPPYLAKNPNSLWAPAVVAAPGSTLYAAGGPEETFAVASTLHPTGFCDDVAQFVVTAYPAAAAMNLDTVFTPPFSVERTTSLDFFQADAPLPESPQ